MKGGKLTVYWNGVRAAMAVLNGARGGIDIPENARKTIYGKLKKYYNKFDKEIPELRLDTGGTKMSTFTEKVVEILKRLSGKDPDDAAKKEINELEISIADEKAKKLEELAGTVTKLNERLEKLEKGNQGKDQKADEVKKVEDLTESVKKAEERLAEIEKRLAESKQPGETTIAQTRTEDKKDVFSGAVFPDRF